MIHLNVCWFLHVHFRWGITLVEDYHYWALLIPSWDPVSGTGPVQVADPHMG